MAKKTSKAKTSVLTYVWTAKGPAKLLKEDQGRLQVLFPGRKKPQWISKTQVVKPPKLIRMGKSANFDQDCGCTAAVDIRATSYDIFNVYGSVKKFAVSTVKAGNDASPYDRRKQLAEDGFTRARGRTVQGKQPAQVAHNYLKKGYKILATKTS